MPSWPLISQKNGSTLPPPHRNKESGQACPCSEIQLDMHLPRHVLPQQGLLETVFTPEKLFVFNASWPYAQWDKIVKKNI